MILSFLIRFLLLFTVYLMLAGSTNLQELIAGALSAIVATWISVKLFSRQKGAAFSLKKVGAIITYPLIFLKALLVANLDVARRVLMPSLPINPGVVAVETRLKSPVGRLVLANSITLTPGTLTVESTDGKLYVHCIELPGEGESAYDSIVRPFEKYLEVIFG